MQLKNQGKDSASFDYSPDTKSMYVLQSVSLNSQGQQADKKETDRVLTTPLPYWLGKTGVNDTSKSKRKVSAPIPAWLRQREIEHINLLDEYLKPFACTICQSYLAPTEFYLFKSGQYYHSKCYNQYHLLTCDICHNPIIGQYTIDLWGNCYHASHLQTFQPEERSHCDTCGRLFCQPITQSRITYGDGRQVCNICHETAVTTDALAKQALNRVRDILGRNGLLIDETLFPIELVNYQTLNNKNPDGQKRSCVLGQFHSMKYSNGQRKVQAIKILWGMPNYKFMGTLAHELGHAWFFLNRVDNLGKQLEEGLCNLLHFLIIQGSPSKQEHFHEAQNLFRNPDQAYGEGFREAAVLLDRRSFGSIMRYVAQNKVLPPN